MSRTGRLAPLGRRAVLQRLTLGALWPAGLLAQAAATATLALSTARGLWLLDAEGISAPRRLDSATAPLVNQALTVWTQAPTRLAAPDGQLLRIDPHTLAVTARRDFGQPLRHAAASADGRLLLLAPGTGEHLLLIDAELNTARAAHPGAGRGAAPA